VGAAADYGYYRSHTNALLDGPLGFNTLVDHLGSGALHIGPRDTGALSPQTVEDQIMSRRFDIPEIRSTTDHVDGLKASLQRASRQIDLVGPKADAAFGQASKDVRDFSAKLDAIHEKQIRVKLDDLAAIRGLENLQAYRLRDKSLTIQVREELERTVGPGGGIGHPTGAAGGGASTPRSASQPAPSSGTGGGGKGATVHIHGDVKPKDYDDFTRQLRNRGIAQAGGGVII
jgi:hypothetical protein